MKLRFTGDEIRVLLETLRPLTEVYLSLERVGPQGGPRMHAIEMDSDTALLVQEVAALALQLRGLEEDGPTEWGGVVLGVIDKLSEETSREQ